MSSISKLSSASVKNVYSLPPALEIVKNNNNSISIPVLENARHKIRILRKQDLPVDLSYTVDMLSLDMLEAVDAAARLRDLNGEDWEDLLTNFLNSLNSELDTVLNHVRSQIRKNMLEVSLKVSRMCHEVEH